MRTKEPTGSLRVGMLFPVSFGDQWDLLAVNIEQLHAGGAEPLREGQGRTPHEFETQLRVVFAERQYLAAVDGNGANGRDGAGRGGRARLLQQRRPAEQ